MKMDLQASLTWVLLLSAALLSEPASGAWSNSPEGSEDKDQKSLWKKFSDWIKSKFKSKEVPQLRLVSGGDRCAGRVEVYYEGKWGTVCDDNFDVNSGSVVCKQLDCGQVVSVLGQSYFGPGKGDIHLDDVVCRGTESYLWDCRHGGWNRHNCEHNEDVSVICSASSQTPQTSTSASTFSTDSTVVTSTTASLISTGKASVTPSASIAATEKTVPSAPKIPTAAYKAPESTAGSSISPTPFAGDGGTSAPEISSTAAEETGNLTTSAPVTESTEPSAAPAPPSTPSKDMSLRLVNGGDTCSGRLEVFHNGSWATVCDDGWDMKDAAVVCRQLGCGDAVSAKTDAFFGEGTGDIILDEVMCRGDESSLEQCSHRGLGTHNCCHKEDVGVICEASEEPTTPEVTVLKSTTAGAPVTTSPTPEPTDVTTLPTESTTAENAVTDSCIPPFSPTPEAAATTTLPTESTTAENAVTDSPALPVSPTPEAAATTTFHQKPDPAPISPEDLTYLPKYVRVMLLRYLIGLCQPRRPGMQSIKLQGCVRDPTCRNYYYYAPGTRIVQFKYRAPMYPRVCLRCKVLACNRYSYPFQHYQGYLARGKRSASDTVIVIIPK